MGKQFKEAMETLNVKHGRENKTKVSLDIHVDMRCHKNKRLEYQQEESTCRTNPTTTHQSNTSRPYPIGNPIPKGIEINIPQSNSQGNHLL